MRQHALSPGRIRLSPTWINSLFLVVSFDVTISIPNAIGRVNMYVDDATTPTSACRWPRVRTPSRGGRARFLANRPTRQRQ